MVVLGAVGLAFTLTRGEDRRPVESGHIVTYRSDGRRENEIRFPPQGADQESDRRGNSPPLRDGEYIARATSADGRDVTWNVACGQTRSGTSWGRIQLPDTLTTRRYRGRFFGRTSGESPWFTGQ